MRPLMLLGAALAALAPVAASKTLGRTAADMPNPTLAYPECGNTQSTRVCDPDLIMTDGDRAFVASAVQMLEAETTSRRRGGLSRCQRVGVHAFVSLVKSIRTSSLRATQADMAGFAGGLRSAWKLDDYCAKFLLVTISQSDRQVHIAAGHRTFVTQGDVGNILRANVGEMKRGEYAALLGNVLSSVAELYNERRLGVTIPPMDDDPEDEHRLGHPTRVVKETNFGTAQPLSGEFPWWGYLVVVLILVPVMGVVLACCLAGSLRRRFCPCVSEEELAVVQVNGQTAFLDPTWAGYGAGGGELRSKSPSIVHSIHGFPLHRSVSGQELGRRAPSLLLPPGYASSRLSRKGSANTSIHEGEAWEQRRPSKKLAAHRSHGALQSRAHKDPL